MNSLYPHRPGERISRAACRSRARRLGPGWPPVRIPHIRPAAASMLPAEVNAVPARAGSGRRPLPIGFTERGIPRRHGRRGEPLVARADPCSIAASRSPFRAPCIPQFLGLYRWPHTDRDMLAALVKQFVGQLQRPQHRMNQAGRMKRKTVCAVDTDRHDRRPGHL